MGDFVGCLLVVYCWHCLARSCFPVGHILFQMILDYRMWFHGETFTVMRIVGRKWNSIFAARCTLTHNHLKACVRLVTNRGNGHRKLQLDSCWRDPRIRHHVVNGDIGHLPKVWDRNTESNTCERVEQRMFLQTVRAVLE